MLHYTVNQCPHWACPQYGHSGETWGWQGRHQEMSTLHAGYILQYKVKIGEQQWVTGFHNELALCVKCSRMADSVPRWQLYPGHYSQNICRSRIITIPSSGWEH